MIAYIHQRFLKFSSKNVHDFTDYYYHPATLIPQYFFFVNDACSIVGNTYHMLTNELIATDYNVSSLEGAENNQMYNILARIGPAVCIPRASHSYVIALEKGCVGTFWVRPSSQQRVELCPRNINEADFFKSCR